MKIDEEMTKKIMNQWTNTGIPMARAAKAARSFAVALGKEIQLPEMPKRTIRYRFMQWWRRWDCYWWLLTIAHYFFVSMTIGGVILWLWALSQ